MDCVSVEQRNEGLNVEVWVLRAGGAGRKVNFTGRDFFVPR